jgi:alpha-tubulin suppressor-like RCC1 family protein
LYGCGKASEYQIQPIKYLEKNEIADKIENPEPIMKGEKLRKATGGLKFSLVWADKNKLYAVGSNKFGQCGQNNIRFPEVKQLTPI